MYNTGLSILGARLSYMSAKSFEYIELASFFVFISVFLIMLSNLNFSTGLFKT